MLLYDGVREVELSSITDAYPCSTASDVLSLAPERSFVKTAHRLDLLPRFDFLSAPGLNRVLLPGTPDAGVATRTDAWATQRGLTAERIHASRGYAYELALRDLARQETRPVAIWAAAWLEYPTADLALEGRDWQVDLIARAIGTGAMGVLALAAAPRILHALRLRGSPASLGATRAAWASSRRP